MIKRIFVDMDGVLSDFDKRYFDLFQTRSLSLKEEGKLEEYNRNWNRFVDEWHFGTLDFFEGAERLVEFLNSLDTDKAILSSSAGFDKFYDIVTQKSYWLKVRKIDWAPVIVPGKRYKKAFADPSTLLIDDTSTNVNDFRNFGGSAILHRNVDETIEEIRKLMGFSAET